MTSIANQQPSKSIKGPALDNNVNNSSFEIEDTFYDLLSIKVNHDISSMSMSPASRDVALGSREGLYIVDLQNPYDPPRFLPHSSGHRPPIDLQWSPFPSRSEWVVSTSNQKAVIYNLSSSPTFSKSPIEHTLKAHTRAITDINWSPNHDCILSTCGLDGWVWEWDLRTGYGGGSRNKKGDSGGGGGGGGSKPVWGVCSWGSGATQVKYNRREEHVIASAHDNRVMIWDDRMGAVPVTIINGHSAKIYGIDWSRRDPKMLITCSLDKSFKSWHLSHPQTPDLTVLTSTPIYRARYLPFGRGALTLPQRGDHALSIWGREKIARGDTAQPVARFEGAREGVKEFVWRTRGGKDEEFDDREFQLVTWSKDRRLRLWPISDEIMKEVGHVKGSKIDIQMTRRNCPNISYRTLEDQTPFSLTSTSPFSSLLSRPLPTASQPSNLSQVIQASPLGGPSLLTSSLATAASTTNTNGIPPNATLAYTNPNSIIRGAATMTANNSSSNLSRIQNAHDRLTWMEGVKVHSNLNQNSNNNDMIEEGGGGGGGDMNSRIVSPEHSRYPSDVESPFSGKEEDVAVEAMTKASTVQGSTRGRGSIVLDRTTVILTGGGVDTRSSSLQRGTDGGTAREGGETERAESALMSGSRTTAQNHNGNGGNGGLVHKNLGEEVTSVVRRFPRVNFEKVHVAGRTCTVSLYTPVFIRATFTFPKSYPHSSPPTIELERNADITLKSRAFLLQSLRKLMASRAQNGLPSLEFALRFLLGERGDLLDSGGKLGKGTLVVEDDDDDEGEEVIRGGLNLTASQTLGRNINVPPPRRGGAIFGPRGQLIVFFPTNVFVSPVNEKEEHTESTPIKSKFPIRVSEAFGNITGDRDSPTEDEYQETDEALQISTGISFRLSEQTHPKRSLNTSLVSPVASFSTTVHIKDFSHLTLLQPERICNFLDRPPLEVAHSALDNAIENRDALLVHLWSTMTCFLEHSHDSAFGLSKQFETVLAERLLPELLIYFTHLRDIQTLGVVACLLEVYRRALAGSAHPNVTLPRAQPSIDYFSPRTDPTPLSYNDRYDPTTPQPRHQNPLLSPSDSSPKASWTNLGALFNNSVLSLRGATPPTPGTLEKMYANGIARPQYSAALSSPRISKISPRIRNDSNSPVESRRSGSGSGSSRIDSAKKPSMERQQSRFRTAKDVPVVTFEDTTTLGGKAKAGEAAGVARKRVVVRYKDPTTIHSPVHWWLTDRAQTELELIRIAYAELLYRWGFDQDRIEVLKLCRSSSLKISNKNYGATLLRAGNGFDKEYGVDLTRSCDKCKAALHAPYLSCAACHTRQKPILCVVCHLPVLKLSQNCTICCHVGHVECLRGWYSSEEECSSGCGCSCVTSGGLMGIFIAEVPEVKAKVAPASVLKPRWGSFRNSLPYFTG